MIWQHLRSTILPCLWNFNLVTSWDKSQQEHSHEIPDDQMHEQLIDWLKNQIGVIENLDDPRTVCRQQVVHPELACLVREFEGVNESEEKRQYEQYLKFQAILKTI